jgi:hypothetical protein
MIVIAIAAAMMTKSFMKSNAHFAAKKFFSMTKCSMKKSLNVQAAAKSLSLTLTSMIAIVTATAVAATKNKIIKKHPFGCFF